MQGNRKHIKLFMHMEISNILWKYNQDNFISTFLLIGTQTILIIVSLIFGIFMKNKEISTTWSHIMTSSIACVNIILCILVVVINSIRTRAWLKAKNKANDLFEILDKSFEDSFTIEDENKCVEDLIKYKRGNDKKYAKRI